MKILVLVGPTAVGKTFISIAIAEALNAEIISADSRQIYRFMDIATAKPSLDYREKIPHHFIDIVDPDETYNAGQFGLEGRKHIDDITARDKNVLVVGGSGLYIRSLTEGFFAGEISDPVIRENIREKIVELGASALHAQLADIDPESAKKISPNDAKRIERALEVFEITGKPISELHKAPKPKFSFESVFYGLNCDRDELYRRIEARIDRMLEEGVIEETQRLINKGYSQNLVSMESLGYREISAYLNGSISKDEMIRQFKQGSRNYAKRQLTWFRKDQRIRWFDVTDPNVLPKTAHEIVEDFKKYL
ncbi:tRNA (adenosine(37)-N6)-dimethylallyltransferase MiaA [bacterium]|nr:tRNA (adenosine(37)-N6)-dimethylallyltransferase MiaA [bacterium]